MKRMQTRVCLLIGFLLTTSLALAQGPNATISGTVRDQTGAVLPGASIQVSSQETGRMRTVITDSGGRYRVPALESGTYTVQASLAGFRTAVKPGVVLTVGSEAVVDLTTEVGQVTESVTVAAEVPLVQTTSAELSGLVGDKEIRDLPLNGRSYEALALLQPGVVQFTKDTRNPTGVATNGAGAKISIGGTPADFAAFLLDGTDIHDHSNFTPASVARNNLGVDSILEFRVLTRNYSAEHGRTAGGVISAVTRSGSNSLHGSAFEFLRNNALDAREFFDRGATKPFRRNQFGAAAGGPILRDHTFFFVNYEGLRDRLAQTVVSAVPDADAHRGFVRGVNVGVAPAIRPYLDLWPLPNSRSFGDGTAQLLWITSNPTREDFGSVRIDHQFSDRNYLFGRLSLDDAEALTPGNLPPFQGILTSRNTYWTLEQKTILSPNLLNVFRGAFNRTNPSLADNAIPEDQALAFIPGRTWNIRFNPQGNAPAPLNEFGHLTFAPQRFVQNIFQYSDDLDFHRGRHSMRMGFNLERIQNNNLQNTNQGNYVFGDLTSLLQARPLQFQARTLDSVVNNGYRMWLVGFYFQDDLKATDRLNLNLGLRYEFISMPTDVGKKQGNILNVLADSGPTRGVVWTDNPSLKNLGPRLGFAWTPFGERKPVFRGGFGIYFNQIMGRLYYTYVRSGFSQNAIIPNASFPRPGLENAAAGTISYSTWDPSPSTPSVYQYNLTVEQQLPSRTVVTLGYAGSHGLHWNREITPNIRIPQFLPDGTPFYTAGGPRRNPNLGDVQQIVTDAVFNYNALQLQVSRRLSGGLQFQASYTYASAITDATAWQQSNTLNAPGHSSIPYRRSADRSLSPWQQRHVLVMNYTYRLPGESLRGMAAVLGKGWEMSGILTAASGNPFTVGLGFNRSGDGNTNAPDRPNLRPGRSNNPVLGKVERWYDPGAFELQPAGFYGNLGRNTVLGPGLATLNFSLVKTFRLTEGHTLAFRSEFFNLFNRANFGLPIRIAFTSSGAYAGSAGAVQSLTSSARQIQFGLRYSF